MSTMIKVIQDFESKGSNSCFQVAVEMQGDTVDEQVYPDGFGPRLHISLYSWTGGVNPEMDLYVEGMTPEDIKDLGTKLIMAGEELKQEYEALNKRQNLKG